MASIEKRGDSYRVTVSAGYDASGRKLRQSATFKPDRLTATGRTKAESVIEKEVQTFAAQFEHDVKAGALSVGGSMRFSELVDCYLEQYAALELEKGTADGYRAILEKRLLPAWGHTRIKELAQKQLDLQSYFNWLALPDRDGRALSPATIKRYMAVLSSVLSWAVNMRLIPSNPMEHVRAPRESYKEPQPKSFHHRRTKAVHGGPGPASDGHVQGPQEDGTERDRLQCPGVQGEPEAPGAVQTVLHPGRLLRMPARGADRPGLARPGL